MYTAAQIITLACQVCNCPGRTSQAGQFLNMILADYAQTEDFDTIRQTTTLNISAQPAIPYPWPLPSNYLRAYDVFYLVNGEPFYLTQMELDDFDKLFTGTGVANYPTRFATDMAVSPGGAVATAPNMYFYPPPQIPLAVTVRYRPQTSDITAPETSTVVPWFPNQLILIEDLCVKLGDLVGDDRTTGWEARLEKRMRKYLIMDDDKEGFSQKVKLDPNSFRSNRNLPPSKLLGF